MSEESKTKHAYITEEIEDRLRCATVDHDASRERIESCILILTDEELCSLADTVGRMGQAMRVYHALLKKLGEDSIHAALVECKDMIVHFGDKQRIVCHRDNTKHVLYGVLSLLQGVIDGEIDID